MTKTDHQFLTLAQLAEELQLSRSTVYRLAREVGFPAVKVRGVIRVPCDEFEAWLAERSYPKETGPAE